ncbi:hypothetical protein ACFL1L_00890 [Thermoplasmatota archaeon]
MIKKSYVIVMLLIFIIFSICGCVDNDLIAAEELDEMPDKFISILEEEMLNFPTLKQAIDNEGLIKIPREEYNELLEFLDEIWFIKYLDKYYELLFAT